MFTLISVIDPSLWFTAGLVTAAMSGVAPVCRCVVVTYSKTLPVTASTDTTIPKSKLVTSRWLMTGLPLNPAADGPLVFLIRAVRARLRADDEILLQIYSRDPRE